VKIDVTEVEVVLAQIKRSPELCRLLNTVQYSDAKVGVSIQTTGFKIMAHANKSEIRMLSQKDPLETALYAWI